MHASEFQRKRAKLERRSGNRSAFFRKAMAHLLREAQATEIRAAGKVVGWRMKDGTVVCIKQRHRDWVEAALALETITQHANARHVPVRAYLCPWCDGFHLTSQAKPKAA